MNLRATIVVLATFATGGVEAQTLSGNQVLEVCSVEDGGAAEGFCVGYTVGVIEGLIWGAAYSIAFVRGDALTSEDMNYLASHMLGFCLPDNAPNSQLRDVVVKHLEDHPETRHETARTIIQTALVKTFPCT